MLNDGTAKRIELKKAARALPRVNKFLAQRLMAEQDGEGDDAVAKKRKKKKGERDLDMGDANPMTDSRFSSMFKVLFGSGLGLMLTIAGLCFPAMRCETRPTHAVIYSLPAPPPLSRSRSLALSLSRSLALSPLCGMRCAPHTLSFS